MRSPKTSLSVILGLASLSALAAHSEAVRTPGYLTDARGEVVRSGLGQCVRTGSWTPELATVIGCDGVMAKAIPVPPAAPAPAEAAPKAAPEPVPPAVVAPVPAVVPLAKPTPASEKVTLDADAFFDFNKSTLKPKGRESLSALASQLSKMQLEVVVATGHTDAVGGDAFNQRLSERRATAVKEFLQTQGVPADRIFVEGKGEKQPIANNKTRDGRAKNRRVLVEVVGNRPKP